MLGVRSFGVLRDHLELVKSFRNGVWTVEKWIDRDDIPFLKQAQAESKMHRFDSCRVIIFVFFFSGASTNSQMLLVRSMGPYLISPRHNLA